MRKLMLSLTQGFVSNDNHDTSKTKKVITRCYSSDISMVTSTCHKKDRLGLTRVKNLKKIIDGLRSGLLNQRKTENSREGERRGRVFHYVIKNQTQQGRGTFMNVNMNHRYNLATNRK